MPHHTLPIAIRRLPHYPANASLPAYASPGAAGCDLIAAIAAPITLTAVPQAIPTGISIAVPSGFEAQVRPRSGLALKFGFVVVNAPGTIDSDYRGEIKVIACLMPKLVFVPLSDVDTEAHLRPASLIINPGDRIAQLILAPVWRANWEVVDDLPATVRGDGGFGSTGVAT